MGPGQSLALGLVIVVVVLLAAAYVWYNMVGWAPFSFKGAVPYAPPGAASSCAAAEACVANNCVAACGKDADCPAGACSSGFCPPSAGKTCCPAGEALVGDRCRATCTPASGCGAEGQVCWGGLCQPASTPSWAAGEGKNIASLRFKSCTFTVVDPQGQKHSADVTAVLNGMAVAFRGAATAVPGALYLDRPLNAFSFVIPGVNDRATVPTPAQAKTWAGCATTLTGRSRTI